MSTKRRLRKSSCTGKIAFDSEDKARAALHRLRIDKGYKGNVYHCHFCQKFHIGRLPYNKAKGYKAHLIDVKRRK